MPEILEELLEKILSGAVTLWRGLTGNHAYELQKSKVRIPDPRGFVYNRIMLRRAPRSGFDCRH